MSCGFNSFLVGSNVKFYETGGTCKKPYVLGVKKRVKIVVYIYFNLDAIFVYGVHLYMCSCMMVCSAIMWVWRSENNNLGGFSPYLPPCLRQNLFGLPLYYLLQTSWATTFLGDFFCLTSHFGLGVMGHLPFYFEWVPRIQN